jgi:hypothetical protein
MEIRGFAGAIDGKISCLGISIVMRTLPLYIGVDLQEGLVLGKFNDRYQLVILGY